MEHDCPTCNVERLRFKRVLISHFVEEPEDVDDDDDDDVDDNDDNDFPCVKQKSFFSLGCVSLNGYFFHLFPNQKFVHYFDTKY